MSDSPATIDHPYHTWDGEQHFDEELALAALLRDGILFSNSRAYAMEAGEPAAGRTTVLFVLCNDAIVPASDAEDLPYGQIESLYRLHRDTPGDWGAIKWCCLRRGVRPRPRAEQRMREVGAWDEQMDQLAANPCC